MMMLPNPKAYSESDAALLQELAASTISEFKLSSAPSVPVALAV